MTKHTKKMLQTVKDNSGIYNEELNIFISNEAQKSLNTIAQGKNLGSTNINKLLRDIVKTYYKSYKSNIADIADPLSIIGGIGGFASFIAAPILGSKKDPRLYGLYGLCIVLLIISFCFYGLSGRHVSILNIREKLNSRNKNENLEVYVKVTLDNGRIRFESNSKYGGYSSFSKSTDDVNELIDTLLECRYKPTPNSNLEIHDQGIPPSYEAATAKALGKHSIIFSRSLPQKTFLSCQLTPSSIF